MGITVQVTPSPPTPTSPASGSGSQGTGSTPRQSTSGGQNVSTDVKPDTADADDDGIGGVIFLSGLSTRVVPSLHPLRGELVVEFTVRNASDTAFDSSAHFWVDGPFGNTISDVDAVQVAGLQPGESRVVSAILPGIGQWTILNAHAVYTPPSSVEGIELTAATRDTVVFAVPWVLLGSALSAAGVVGLVLLGRRLVLGRIARATA